jgi:hypothetical protein
MACTASILATGLKSVPTPMRWACCRHARCTSLTGPPPSRTLAPTMIIAVMEKGDRSRKLAISLVTFTLTHASQVSTLGS